MLSTHNPLKMDFSVCERKSMLSSAEIPVAPGGPVKKTNHINGGLNKRVMLLKRNTSLNILDQFVSAKLDTFATHFQSW